MMPDSAWLQGALRKVVAAVLGLLLALVLLVALLITGFYMLVNAATLALAPVLGEAGAMAVTGFFCILLLVLFFLSYDTAGQVSRTGRFRRKFRHVIAGRIFKEPDSKEPSGIGVYCFCAGHRRTGRSPPVEVSVASGRYGFDEGSRS